MALANQPPTPEAVIGAIDTLGAFVESFEPGRYAGGDAATLVATFTKGERLCAAGKTLAARRAAEANQHQAGGHRSAAHWLATVTGESIGEAAEVLTLGDSLASHPGVDAAYREGKLSRSKAKAIAGAVRVNPDSEDELVATAEGDTAREVRDRCQRAKAQGRSRQDAKARYDAIHRDRSCRTWTDAETGAFRLDARLTPDAGAALLASLKPESDRVFHRARRAGVKESPDAYAADALVALITGGTGSTDPASDDQTSTPNPDDDHTTKSTKATRAVVHVRVDLDALRSGVVGPGGICEIPGVGPIPVDTAIELMGDALCDLVITNGVDVTTICRMGRGIPLALQTALDERDATCVVPGCDATTGLENDHRIVEYHQDGPMALWNLAKLCSHHHHLKHHEGFTLTGGPGHWQWIPPGGDPDPPDRPETLPPVQPPRRRSTPNPSSTRPSNQSKRSMPSTRPSSTPPAGRKTRKQPPTPRPGPSPDAPRLFPKQE
jgi:hypothetical protein